jgi:RNA polymerase sigma factor (TIGR02999 family)
MSQLAQAVWLGNLSGGNMETSSAELTRLLQDGTDGSREALDELLPLVYEELRRVAHRYLSHERQDHTLQTTALVHEAYMKLIDQHSVNWQNRAQFFALSAQAMRRILIDSARKHTSAKRGSGGVKLSLDEAASISGETADESLLALDLALLELEKIDGLQSKIIELRYFGGLTIEETAEVLKSSPATVKREWTMARAWLYKAIMGSEDSPAEPNG